MQDSTGKEGHFEEKEYKYYIESVSLPALKHKYMAACQVLTMRYQDKGKAHHPRTTPFSRERKKELP